jgi:T5SS/PEP-CTERM-associated repeat protein
MRRSIAARRHRIATAVSLLLCAQASLAVVEVTGAFGTDPGGLAIGPGDTDLSGARFYIGTGALGTLLVDAGSQLSSGTLAFATGGTGAASGLISGSGTRVNLTADGKFNRFEVGNWGIGAVTVAAGAILDGRTNVGACTSGNQFCNNFIGQTAGSDGTFTVTGSGSEAYFLKDFVVGDTAVFRPPYNSFTFGTPGGTSTGRVHILGGGLLVTDYARLGRGPTNPGATGTERSFAELLVNGPGSTWRVTGGTVDGGEPYFGTALGRNAWADVRVENGGSIRMGGTGDTYSSVNLTVDRGRTDAIVTGSGSNITFESQSGVLQVGRSLGSATLEVRDGGRVEGMFYASVGRDGSLGTLVVDGPTSLFRVDGTATAAALGVTAPAFMDIGRAGGNGNVTVSNGARLELLSASSTTNGTGMNLARDANSAGTLNITGGAVVQLRAESVAPGTAAETWNPTLAVGRDGSGTLNISGGGKLLVEGNAVSTPTQPRNTNLFIGGSLNFAGGGKGSATVTGAGSAILVSGADNFMGVGDGATASGNLTASDGASIAAMIMHVGSRGGVGVAKFDNATIELTGQYTGVGGQPGATLVVGFGAGSVGNVSASNGTTIRVANAGSNGGGVSIGGTANAPGGDGTLTLSASSLVFDFPNSNAGLNVGRNGSGLLRLQKGSTVDLGNEFLYVAREIGSDGTLIATGGSTITAGWVGVGRNLAGGGTGTDGGTGTMVLNGATLNAENVVIGTNGYLGGSAGSINVSGSVTNYGTFSPGSSPGTFAIGGDYTAGSGSRLILEIESTLGGGFLTDLVLFDVGAAVNFGESAVEFRFLGKTDPEAFEATGGFNIGAFLQLVDGSGGLDPLEPSVFKGVAFSASSSAYQITDFTYDPATGGFTVTAVPELGTWALMFGGLLLIAGAARRRLATLD